MKDSFLLSSWEEVKCIYCEGDPPARLIWPDDIRGNILRCSRCGLAFRSPRKKEEALTRHFTEEWTENRPSFYLEEYRQKNLRTIVNWLTRYYPGPRTVLDIGASYGNLLAQFPADWEKVGIEPSRESSQICQKRLPKARILNGVLHDSLLPPGGFDIITMVDTIYYLAYPLRDLKIIRSLLKPEGIFLLESPNFSNRQHIYRWMGHAFDDTWMYFYTPQTLTQILYLAGMNVNFRFDLPGHRVGSTSMLARLLTWGEFFFTKTLRHFTKRLDLVPHFVLVAQPSHKGIAD